jgi:hypothetical protein
MKKITQYIAALALVAASAAPASSANIVHNGDFESYQDGWSLNGWEIGNAGRGVHAGEGSAFTGCPYPEFECTFGQTLSTVAGQRYNLSFWLYSDGIVKDGEVSFQFDNGLQVFFGSEVVKTIHNFPTTNTSDDFFPGGPLTRIVVNDLLATSASTYLQFAGYHGPAGLFVDEISVEAVGEVPEPGTLVLSGLALAGLYGANRRRAPSRSK